MILSEDFEDFLRLLNQYEVDYLVVGGYAMAFHGNLDIQETFSGKCN